MWLNGVSPHRQSRRYFRQIDGRLQKKHDGYWQLLREDRFLEYYIVKELWCLVCFVYIIVSLYV